MEIGQYIVATDQELVDMGLEGDSQAFAQLFSRYRDSIYQFYLSRLDGNRDDADDLLQETFIKVFVNLHKYKPNYTFGQWIYTIARNTFIDFVRKRRDDMSLDNLTSGAQATPAAAAPTPEESIINSQQRMQIEGYLERMSERYRTLIRLRFFKEYSYEEIAAELSLPMGTVKTQIHRAREQMCRMIVEESDILS